MCSSVHSLCFHHNGQKHPAVESSRLCAHTGHSPSVAQPPRGFPWCIRKRLRCHEVGEQLFLSHPPAFRVCIFQLSFPFSSVTQTAALTPSPALCWKSQSLVHQRAASIPAAGWVGPWNNSAVPVLLCPYSACGDLD